MAKNRFLEMIPVQYPVIMAPMFLVTNAAMIKAALDSGITGAMPAHNFRTTNDLRAAIREIKEHTKKPFGINLIVNKSNLKMKGQLEVVLEEKVDFIITSLGSPRECIERAQTLGIRVFCDVVDLEYALKVEQLGADGVIAVNSNAGGHAGNTKPEQLIPLLQKRVQTMIISSGGIADGNDINHHLNLGASAVSVGTVFIASEEAPVAGPYKQALVKYGAKDIVRTKKISGTPLTVINTPFVQTIGTETNWIQSLMNKNKTLKKYVKTIVALQGSKTIERAALGATYKNVWVAGPIIERIRAIRPVHEIVADLRLNLKF